MAKVADTFSEKAEAIYDQNPEENGLLAQPYADIADLVGEASMAFEAQAPVDSPLPQAHTPSAQTVSQVVAKKVTGNPWGGR